jgi:hypothetical protein
LFVVEHENNKNVKATIKVIVFFIFLTIINK